MRLTTIIVFGLSLFLIAGSLVFYWFPPGEQFPPDPGSGLEERLLEQQRVKGLITALENGEPKLFYLVGYEPMTRRTSWIYMSPSATVMAPSLGRRSSLEQLYSDLGPQGFATELEDIFNINITFQINGSTRLLTRGVDLLGGVSIPFEEPPTGLSEDLPRRWLDGPLLYDYAANAYAEYGLDGLRYRHKTVLLGIIRRLRENPRLLGEEEIIASIFEELQTNLKLDEFKMLSHLLGELEKDKIKFLSATITDSEDENNIEVERVVNMLPPPVKHIIETTPPQEEIKLQILNGTDISGLASRYREKLQPLDFIDVVEVDNADHPNYRESRFIDRGNQPQSAYRLRQLLKAGRLEVDPAEDLLVDVTFIIGEDLAELPQLESNR